MKVLQINCTYRQGSTGKIVYDLHKYLQHQGHDAIVCYGRGKDTHDSNVYRLCSNIYGKAQNLFSRITGLMYGGCFLSTSKLISVIKKEKPDIIHLHCLNGYFVNIYRLLNWLKKNEQKTVLTLHAEFMYTANCGHSFECGKWLTGCGNCPRRKEETHSLLLDATAKSWKKLSDAYSGFEKNMAVVSVSPWLMNRAKRSPMLRKMNHTCIFNGLDTSVFHLIDETRKDNVIKKETSVLLVTACFNVEQHHPKGGYYLVQIAKRMPTVKFLVAGRFEVNDVLPSNIVLLGNIEDQDSLAMLYGTVDLSIILSKRETFSMPVAESLCCGTPVVGFCAGGPEQIAITKFCEFVDYGDIDALEKVIESYLTRQFDSSEISALAKTMYDSSYMAESYMDVYRRLYDN